MSFNQVIKLKISELTNGNNKESLLSYINMIREQLNIGGEQLKIRNKDRISFQKLAGILLHFLNLINFGGKEWQNSSSSTITQDLIQTFINRVLENRRRRTNRYTQILNNDEDEDNNDNNNNERNDNEEINNNNNKI